jgi:hypothetical protein
MVEQETEERRTPDLPSGPMTTGDAFVSMFDMSHDINPQMKRLANLLTKGNLSSSMRAIYINAINTALILKSKGLPKLAAVYMNRAATDLMAMVSEKGGRMKDFLKPVELELHHERRKDEEKPKI